MKSAFPFDISQPNPRSYGSAVPSASWPIDRKPFSTRRTWLASEPTGRMPNSRPSRMTASHSGRMSRGLTLTSNDRDPVKLTLTTLAGRPATLPSLKLMKGNASRERSMSVPNAAMRSLALGPQRVAFIH